MALLPHPSFVGKITVSSVNNKVYWNEFNTLNFILSTTIADGSYYPDELIALLDTGMDAASLSSGLSNEYIWSFSIETGKFAAREITGNGTWRLDARISDTENILYGKGTDSAGNALGTGQWGSNGMGWIIVSTSPAHVGDDIDIFGDQQMQNFWAPGTSPQATDNGKDFQSTSAQASAIDGTIKTYDFGGWEDSISEFPMYGTKSRKRMLRFEFVTTAKKDEWIHHFWGPYGKAGKLFRFYPDSSDSADYSQNILVEERLNTHGMSDRLMGYTWWSAVIGMQRQ